jgi:C4-dicarboxylate-binding protein DctP
MRRALLAAGLTAAFLLSGVATASAEAFRLSIGAGQPADSAIWLAAMRDWMAPEIAKRVAERTDHEINWVDGFGGTICKMGDCLEAIETGLIDIADAHANFEPAKLMANNFGMFVPFGAADPMIAAKAAQRVYDNVPELAERREEEYNQIFITTGVVGTYHLLTNFPWEKLDDLKNHKIAAAGPNAPWLAAVGAIPVQSALGEAYTALQTGVYEGWIMIPDGVAGFKLHEVAKHYVLANFGAIPNMVISINKDTWEGLPKEVRDIIMEVGREFPEAAARMVTDKQERSLQTMRDAGVEIREMSDQDRREWAARLPEIPKERTAEIEAAGQPSQTVAEYLKALKELGVELPRDWAL